MTFDRACDLYLAEGCDTKKASTIATDRGRIDRHIKPLLGKKRVSDITRADVFADSRMHLRAKVFGKFAHDRVPLSRHEGNKKARQCRAFC